MSQLYHGHKSFESPGKTAARAWLYAEPARQRKSFYSGYHIVIASRECGDIKYLMSHGVSPKKIIACDIDPVARAAARQFGVVVSPFVFIHETVVWTVNLSRKIATVNLDLCMNVHNSLRVVSQVCDSGLSVNVPLFLTFCRYRDGMGKNVSDATRVKYLADNLMIDLEEKDYFCYQSSTVDSLGSPMCAVKLS